MTSCNLSIVVDLNCHGWCGFIVVIPSVGQTDEITDSPKLEPVKLERKLNRDSTSCTFYDASLVRKRVDAEVYGCGGCGGDGGAWGALPC
jgi:hypothetical protein